MNNKITLISLSLLALMLTACADTKLPTFADAVKSQSNTLEKIGTNYERGKATLDEGNKMIEAGNKKILEGQKLINDGTNMANEGMLKAEEGKGLMYNSTETYNNTIMSSPVYLYQGGQPMQGSPSNPNAIPVR